MRQTSTLGAVPFWAWLFGGGIALFALKARADKKAAIDRLAIGIVFRSGYQLTDTGPLVAAIAGANAVCPGLPPLGEVLEIGQTATGLRIVVQATYGHDRTGPINQQPLDCLTAQLRKANPNVAKVAAERPSAQ